MAYQWDTDVQLGGREVVFAVSNGTVDMGLTGTLDTGDPPDADLYAPLVGAVVDALEGAGLTVSAAPRLTGSASRQLEQV